MASEFHRLLEAQQIKSTSAQDREQWYDAGAYKQLNVEVLLPAVGSVTGGTTPSFVIGLEHASTPEDAAFVALQDKDGNNVEVDLLTGSPGNGYFQVEGFLRYIRWVAKLDLSGGTMDATPVAGVDLVAKQ